MTERSSRNPAAVPDAFYSNATGLTVQVWEENPEAIGERYLDTGIPSIAVTEGYPQHDPYPYLKLHLTWAQARTLALQLLEAAELAERG